MTDRALIPCDGCRACCLQDEVFLHPEHGDDPLIYQTIVQYNRLTKANGTALARKANGECVYLASAGCLIWGRAPFVCQQFDCRKLFLKFNRNQRRAVVKAGLMNGSVFHAGRKRLWSLEPAK